MATSGNQGEKKAVVLAIDASKQAEHAANYYLDHLHKVGNQVVMVHIIELPDTDHARQQYLSPNALAEMWKEELVSSKTLEAKFRDIFSGKGVTDVRMRNEGGMKPGQTICQVGEQEKAIMIVMGTRGMGKIRRTIMGSVSDYVVHHSHCPVVVCRKAEDVIASNQATAQSAQ